jgi:hypothetical protein
MNCSRDRGRGAAGGVTQVAHQIGGSLGLAVFAAADSDSLNGAGLLAHRIGASLTAGAGMLALALLIALAVRPRRPAEIAVKRAARSPLQAEARRSSCHQRPPPRAMNRSGPIR